MWELVSLHTALKASGQTPCLQLIVLYPGAFREVVPCLLVTSGANWLQVLQHSPSYCCRWATTAEEFLLRRPQALGVFLGPRNQQAGMLCIQTGSSLLFRLVRFLSHFINFRGILLHFHRFTSHWVGFNGCAVSLSLCIIKCSASYFNFSYKLGAPIN